MDGRTGRQLLRQEVTEGIKHYILENRLRPGDPLPTEAALCEALGASRSSVREAVKTLHALDIVEVRHGHGTYVGGLSLAALVESLTFRGMLGADDDMRVMADLLEARELFERGLAERIAAGASAEYLDTLDVLVARMREQAAADGADGAGFVEADRAFHAHFVSASGNALIGQLSVAFWDVYALVAPYLNVVGPGDGQDTVAAHQRIVDAARAGDADGLSAALADHYAPLRRRLAESRARAAAEANTGESAAG
ncbi:MULTISPECIES: FadR/GntR family transcriptional regulator [Streptomyces]|uniref:Transcriptional regulator n=1 Tax=Streptomyces cacaoi TaxID=1898 RepID=A0A4Y3R4F2_STRCI|nr:MULTISPECIES: FadR/GntR family transcriptional regulator [Streptomyces]NNG88758.1 FadR family transcriptional regulator [Streptomyces cacaoi]GEB52434.1 transcriptional regulator [Streptomyces cacaoi]